MIDQILKGDFYMAIIKRKKGKTTQVYEVIYEGLENGRRKYKWKLLYKLDENGKLIPSKKRNSEELPTETEELSMTATSENVENENTEANHQVPQEIKALAIPEKGTQSEKTETVEAEIVDDENLPQVISKKSPQYKFGISKVDNITFDDERNSAIYDAVNEEDVSINVGRANSNKRVETLIYIDFNDAKKSGITISNEERITPYDREIHNAVASLAAEGNQYISTSMIFQLLSGNTSDERNKMSEETRKRILRSIEKMSATRITVNASAEVKAGMIAKATYVNYLIPSKRVEIILNGQRVKDCIQLLDSLPLFDYASQKNQIASIDIKMLDAPIQNSPENITLKGYLLRRIMAISNSKYKKNNMNNVIRYDTIYQYLKVQASTKDLLNHKRKQIRDKVKKLLDFWKKEKLIKNYKEEKEGRVIAKIIIFR